MVLVLPSNPVSMTFYPDYRAMNPYQSMLYDGLRPFVHAKSGTIEDALAELATAEGQTHIFHLQWEHQVFREPTTSVENFLNDLASYHDAGGKVIWTLHNLAPHENFPAEQVSDLYAGLSSIADVVHIHSIPAVAAAMDAWALPPRKIRIIPHANYAGAYPVLPRAQARQALGLAPSDMMLLLPGRIAQYKDPQHLISTFLQVAGASDKLIVAGHFANGIPLDSEGDNRVILREGFASAEELSSYHAAANIVILPYVRSLTSGSAILAATLGRGVLGSDTPGLRDVVASGSTGILYDPDAENGLSNALAAALKDGPQLWDKRGAAAARSSSARDQSIVSSAWRDMIAGLLTPSECGYLGEAV